MPADVDEIYRSIRFNLDGVDFSKWPKLSCSGVNELTVATPDDPNPGTARLAIAGTLKLQTGVPVSKFSVDGTLAGNSDLAVPTEKAVKTYIDSQISQLNSTLSTKAALAGSALQDFQAKVLTVSGDLTVKGNVSIGTPTNPANLKVNGTVEATLFTGDGSGLTGVKTIKNGSVAIAQLNATLVAEGSVSVSNDVLVFIQSTKGNEHAFYLVSLTGVSASSAETGFPIDFGWTRQTYSYPRRVSSFPPSNPVVRNDHYLKIQSEVAKSIGVSITVAYKVYRLNET